MIYPKDLIEHEVYQVLMEPEEEEEHLIVNSKHICLLMDANRTHHIRMVLDLVPRSIYYIFVASCTTCFVKKSLRKINTIIHLKEKIAIGIDCASCLVMLFDLHNLINKREKKINENPKKQYQ